EAFFVTIPAVAAASCLIPQHCHGLPASLQRRGLEWNQLDPLACTATLYWGAAAGETMSSPSSNDTGPPSPSPTLPSPRRRGGGRTHSASCSRRETATLLFVLAFVLNGLNGRAIMKPLKASFGNCQSVQGEAIAPDASPREEARPKPEPRRAEDTAIVVTSSWIPSHLSTYMVETVLNFTNRPIGLSPDAPVIITVDYFPYTDFKGTPKYLEERIDKLEAYVVNLHNLFLTNPRVHVVTNAKQLHISGLVLKAMSLIERHYPDVRYLYYHQHDFFFIKDTNHMALVEAMDDHLNLINYVRFPKRAPWDFSRECGKAKTIWHFYNVTSKKTTGNGTDSNPTIIKTETKREEIKLYPTKDYSDNNHLVRFSWYKDAIASLGMTRRAPEDPMQKRAYGGCKVNNPIGLYLYFEQNIAHLDGRHRTRTP
ncbi:hypothetical protein ACHAWF_011237, partial [Thalassiosira exigua]